MEISLGGMGPPKKKKKKQGKHPKPALHFFQIWKHMSKRPSAKYIKFQKQKCKVIVLSVIFPDRLKNFDLQHTVFGCVW